MSMGDAETTATPAPIQEGSRRGPGGRQPGAGRKATHGAVVMRRTLRALTTRRLDGRSALAVAVRRWKEDVRSDLGSDLSRAQETILEAAAQAWVILASLDDWIARQPSLVTKKRTVLPVVVQRMQIAEGLARNLERLGLERRAKPVPELAAYLATKDHHGRDGDPVLVWRADTRTMNPTVPEHVINDALAARYCALIGSTPTGWRSAGCALERQGRRMRRAWHRPAADRRPRARGELALLQGAGESALEAPPGVPDRGGAQSGAAPAGQLR